MEKIILLQDIIIVILLVYIYLMRAGYRITIKALGVTKYITGLKEIKEDLKHEK